MIIPPQYITYCIIAFILIHGVGLYWFLRLERKSNRILGGKNVKDLETSILEVHKNVKENAKFRSDMETYLRQVEKRLRRAFQSVETVRFDAFAGNGSSGNQSFATAYVSEKGDGVIISSLSARERISLFSKPIKDWKSTQELSPEEKEALEKAKAALSL